MGYLDEVTRRRIAALLLVAGIVVGVLALADVGPFSNPPSQQEKAAAAVEDFFAAARAKDAKGMCALLTPAAQTQVLQRTVAILAGQVEVHSCKDALDAVLKSSAGGGLVKTQVAKVSDSRVSGNRAAVDVELAVPGKKRTQPQSFQLELVRDQWKISGSVF